MANGLIRWLSAALVLGSLSCSDPGSSDDTVEMNPDEPGTPPGSDPSSAGQPGSEQTKTPADAPPTSSAIPGEPEIPSITVLASLVRAADCSDLRTRVQDDAIAKLKMEVERYKREPLAQGGPGGLVHDAGTALGGFASSAVDEAARAAEGAPPPSVPSAAAGGSASDSASAPVSASDTNKQVEDVDEADFVKVVENGRGIFLLHGNALRKLTSWPAEQTALSGEPLVIEGSPSEMFVTDQGKAVIFSSVYGYGAASNDPTVVEGISTRPSGGGGIAVDCAFDGPCGGFYGGVSMVKITIADVTGAAPKTERELYYEGWYVSSRGYPGEIVRAVVQANSKYAGLYQPNIEWSDPWGRPYDAQNIASQLDEWEKRTTASIRNTALSDWLPTAKEAKNGELEELSPDCGSYFVPDPGLADYGLTHVLSLAVNDPAAPVGGVTIVGASSTVYSNAARLVLAQPDYRWNGGVDFGIIDEQRTALHVFDLSGASTGYAGSGFVPGHLPPHNPQFGIDVGFNGTIRLATTGWVRQDPTAAPGQDAFWQQRPQNRVFTAAVEGGKVQVLGKTDELGHEGESVQSARFVGDRAYVVTFRQTDPLIVVDVVNAYAPTVLGEIEIPGFSQYMHPLDATHLITLGQSENRGIQLQLFDVTYPKNIPAPKVIDFGDGTSSEVSYNHKAFTLFEGLLAIPLYGYSYGPQYTSYSSGLEVLRVDAQTGFQRLGTVDHARLYADNGAGVRCGRCDEFACYDYVCGSYAPEVRRGHFVKGEDKTYVYSFSYAGVLVNDLSYLPRPVASVGLPAPIVDASTPWYGGDDSVSARDAGAPPPSMTPPSPVQDAGVATTGP